jgi:hypothetical protein
MSLVKWMRKYNKRIMAVVVILLMFAFIGGSALQYILQGSGGANDAVAYYGPHKKKITRYDLSAALQELEILQSLRMNAVLAQQRDLRWLLLGELIFSESRGSAAVMNQAAQIIQQYQLPVSEKQLSAFYERMVSPAVYWILLRQEAESAGVRVPPEQASASLAQAIPNLFPGQTYGSVMTSVTERFRVSEQNVIAVLGRLLSVLEYARAICSTEDVTIPQLTHMASWSGDSVDAEVVQLEAEVFADKQAAPTDEAIRAQFDTYKGDFSGHVSADNLFGFGYKLPDRVQLEYVALKLADVARIVPTVTHEEAMEYYRQNRSTVFMEEVPSDPNDPNSPRIQRPRSYADVEDMILQQLKQQRISRKAEQILDEVRNVADANNPETGDTEAGKLSVEELKKRAGDYGKIAQQVAAREKITLYSGQTGWLSAMDVQTDETLGRLYVPGQGSAGVPLTQVLFSIDALGEDAAVLMFATKPRLYGTIGPARNPMGMRSPDLSGQVMLIARIAGVSKAAEPENPDVTFSTKTVDLGQPPKSKKQDVYSVKAKVTEDLQKLAAWDTTRAKAEEFVALASKDGWEPAISKFNDLYGKQAKEDPNDPNVFRLDPLAGLRRIPNVQLQIIAAQGTGSPMGTTMLDQAEVEKRLVDQLFALVPPDATSAPNMPQVLEFKPGQCFYAVKSLSARWLDQQQYERRKPMLLQREDAVQMQSLAIVHFNPGNILKRTNFRFAQETPAEKDKDKAGQKSKDAT